MTKRINALYVVLADSDAGTVTVRADGQDTVIRVADLPDAIRMQAMVHGIKQKIGDAGAVTAGDNGKVDPNEKLRRVMDMAERIGRGVWNERSVGGTSDDHVLIRALLIAYPAKTRDTIAAYVDGLKPAEKRALLAPQSPIAAQVQSVRSELATGVDADSILGKLLEA